MDTQDFHLVRHWLVDEQRYRSEATVDVLRMHPRGGPHRARNTTGPRQYSPSLEADDSFIRMYEGRDPGEVWNPQRQRQREDAEHEQRLGHALPRRPREAEAIARPECRSRNDERNCQQPGDERRAIGAALVEEGGGRNRQRKPGYDRSGGGKPARRVPSPRLEADVRGRGLPRRSHPFDQQDRPKSGESGGHQQEAAGAGRGRRREEPLTEKCEPQREAQKRTRCS